MYSRQDKFQSRQYIIRTIFIVVAIIFLVRLFLLQVIDNDYKLSAQNNVLRHITKYPARGLVYDRNGELLIYNEASYDLMVIPRQIGVIDTSLLCQLIKIDSADFCKRLAKAKSYSPYIPSIFLQQISKEDYGFLEEQLYKFPGFYVQSRTLRKYPKAIAAHLLGYVGEVDPKELKNDTYYEQGDYIGKSGIESFYEKELRGAKGLEIRMVDVFNREKGSFQNGKYDSAAVSGTDLHLTIDANLQAYGEYLMQGKKGSIVAIEPKSGEILAMVSSPTYDPNLLIGRIRNENFSKLSSDTLEPLFNRAIMAQYPPGSTFKPVNAIIGLDEGVLHSYTKYECAGTSATPIVCSHNHYSPLDMEHAIEQSCNPYFWKVYQSIIEQPKFETIQEGYANWRNDVMKFGIGERLPGDLKRQRKGNIPDYTYFDRYYGKKGWRAITNRSLSVGQGEIELTPLQLANVAAIFANRGYYFPPHVVKAFGEDKERNLNYINKIETGFSVEYFEEVIKGMQLVYEGEHGTARWYKTPSIKMCGKTGSAENPFGETHSVFIAFAPADDPKIAIGVLVENKGSGATFGAPIATLMMRKYLMKELFETPWFEKTILNE